MSTCEGRRTDGEPCQAPTGGNQAYCHHHENQADQPDRCQGTTNAGNQCKLNATQGDRCRYHVPGKRREDHGNSLLTEDRKETILRMARKAPFMAICADAANIRRRTLQDWMADGRKDIENGDTDTLQAELVRGFQDAKSNMGGNLLGSLARMGLSGDRAAAKYLASRMYPNELTDEMKVKHDGEVQGGPRVQVLVHPDMAADEDPDLEESEG